MVFVLVVVKMLFIMLLIIKNMRNREGSVVIVFLIIILIGSCGDSGYFFIFVYIKYISMSVRFIIMFGI